MKKIMVAAMALGMVTLLTGCPDNHRYKQGKYNKHTVSKHHGKGNSHSGRLPGDNGRRTPNCAADGPGCGQYNPRR